MLCYMLLCCMIYLLYGIILQNTILVQNQAFKTSSEKLLIDAQELLVDQQKLTEVNTTTKVLREGELLAAQELKTVLQTLRKEILEESKK